MNEQKISYRSPTKYSKFTLKPQPLQEAETIDEVHTDTALVWRTYSRKESVSFIAGFMAGLRHARDFGLPETLHIQDLRDPVRHTLVVVMKFNQEGTSLDELLVL